MRGGSLVGTPPSHVVAQVQTVVDALDGVPLKNASPMRGARMQSTPPPGGELQAAAERLVHVVLTSGRCTDNVTVVLCLLPGYDASADA